MAGNDSTVKMTPEEQRILDGFDVVLLPLRSFIELIENDDDHASMATVLTAIERDLYRSMEGFIAQGHDE